MTSVFEYKGCLRWCQHLHVLLCITQPRPLCPGRVSITAGAEQTQLSQKRGGGCTAGSKTRGIYFHLPSPRGWTGSPCASLLAAGGHSVDMDHWRRVYVGGAEPATLASGQQGNCLCQGFAETQRWWKRDGGSCPKGHRHLFFLYFEYVFGNIGFKNSAHFSSNLK